MSENIFKGLVHLRDFKAKRVSRYDQRGKSRDYISIPGDQKAVLTDIKGAGYLTHIWFTIACEDRFYLRNLISRMFWDEGGFWA